MDCRALALAVSGLVAQDQKTPLRSAPDFSREVVPILRICARCHNADLAEGGLRLDSRAGLRKGGNSGKAVVPGDATASLLFRRLTDTDPLRRMPQIRDPLSQEQIDIVRRWIDAGARWPTGVTVGPRKP